MRRIHILLLGLILLAINPSAWSDVTINDIVLEKNRFVRIKSRPESWNESYTLIYGSEYISPSTDMDLLNLMDIVCDTDKPIVSHQLDIICVVK